MRIAVVAVVLFALAGAMTMECDLSFPAKDLRLVLQNGFTTVNLPRCVPTWDVGAPSLPIFIARMVIPQGTRIAHVWVTPTADAKLIGCSLEVWPVQEPRPISALETKGMTEPNPRYYNNSPYPVEVAAVARRGSMFGYNLASVLVAPVQYAAGTKTLTFYQGLSLRFELVPDGSTRQPVGRRSRIARAKIESSLKRLVLNPDDVSRFAPKGQ